MNGWAESLTGEVDIPWKRPPKEKRRVAIVGIIDLWLNYSIFESACCLAGE